MISIAQTIILEIEQNLFIKSMIISLYSKLVQQIFKKEIVVIKII